MDEEKARQYNYETHNDLHTKKFFGMILSPLMQKMSQQRDKKYYFLKFSDFSLPLTNCLPKCSCKITLNDAIMTSLKYELKSCPNKAGWCYIVDNVHLKVFPAHIKA